MEEKQTTFKPLDPLLHSELRLAVMSILIGVVEADFVYIKSQTGATAGNLSVQLDKLSAAEYIQVEKTFKGKKTCTLCRMTEKGRNAFTDYVETLKQYLQIHE
ncbi:MAG: transcriptional regulator [Bacteroidales bacterium]|nr:transcriptional regulator [Bacteroidales bacterium]